MEMTNSASGKRYYLNTLTGQTSLEPPAPPAAAPTRTRRGSSFREGMRRLSRAWSSGVSLGVSSASEQRVAFANGPR